MSALATIPDSTKVSLQQRLSQRAGQRWPALTAVQVSFRVGFAGGGGAVRTLTEKDVSATAGLQGKKQPKELSDEAKAVSRSATVTAEIALKQPHIGQDFIDAFVTKNAGPGILVTFTTEMLYRVKIWGKATTITVADWSDGVSWDITVQGRQDHSYNDNGTSTGCDSFYHEAGRTTMDFKTTAPIRVTFDPDQIANGAEGVDNESSTHFHVTFENSSHGSINGEGCSGHSLPQPACDYTTRAPLTCGSNRPG